MKIGEEKFDASDISVINGIYSKHIRSFWTGQVGLIFLSLIGPIIPGKRHRTFPETAEEYRWAVLLSLIFFTTLWVSYFYYSKRALIKDQKQQTKDILEFEVLKKERLFQNNTFYIFIGDNEKEAISKELYEVLQKGDKVRYEVAKFSKERLSPIRKY